MAYFRRKSLINVLLLAQLTQAIILLPPFGNRTYVQPGKDVMIPWNYTDLNYNLLVRRWYYRNNSTSGFKQIISIVLTLTPDKPPDSPLTNIEVKNRATLVLKNVTMKHNGTYQFEITLLVGVTLPKSNVFVIILEQPQAIINCPKSNYVEKGKSFLCLCENRKGNPPPTASWYWENGMVIGETGYLKKNLLLENFSEAQPGTYRCKVQSHNLTDETNITISLNTKPTASITCPTHTFVEEGRPFTCLCSGIGGNPTPNAYWVKQGENTPRNGVTSMYNTLAFNNIKETDNGTYVCIVESLKLRDEKLMHIFVTYKPRKPELKLNVRYFILGSSVEISCNSDGNPEPKLTLVHNETISLNYTATNTGIVYIIRRVTYSNSGIYECTATNLHGNSTNRTILNVLPTAPTATPTRARTTNGSGNASDRVDCDDGGTKWYISVISLLCGILIGVVITYGTGYIRRRKKKTKKTVAPPEYATPSSQSAAAKNNPVYQELNLKDMNKDENYQALKRNTRSGRNNEAVVENESGYQELNKVREKGDDNYQSLNRV